MFASKVTTPSFAVSMKLDEVLKYITDVKLVFGGYIFAMNKKFFNSLPADQKANVTSAAKAATKWNQGAIHSEIKVSVDKAAKNGVEVIPASADEIARWQKAMKPVHDGLDDEVKALLAKAVALK